MQFARSAFVAQPAFQRSAGIYQERQNDGLVSLKRRNAFERHDS